MGQAVLKPSKSVAPTLPKLLEETQCFAAWTLADVKELLKRFQQQVFGFALVEAQFEAVMSFKEDMKKKVDLEELFHILDQNHDGRVDGLEMLGGIALCCSSPFEEKARFCFELYDFNLNSTMSRREMIVMMIAVIGGINMLTGGGEDMEPDVETIEILSEDAFMAADRDGSGSISYDEFVAWARSNRDLMAAVESLNKVALDAKKDVEPDDSAPETDDGEMSDAFPSLEHGTEDAVHVAKKAKSEHNEGHASESVAAAIAVRLGDHSAGAPAGTGAATPGAPASATSAAAAPAAAAAAATAAAGSGLAGTFATLQWKGVATSMEPTNFKARRRDREGPDTNLELCWAFGYRTIQSRNNMRYIGDSTDPDTQMIVYPTAALAVVRPSTLNPSRQPLVRPLAAVVCLDMRCALPPPRSLAHIRCTTSRTRTNGSTKATPPRSPAWQCIPRATSSRPPTWTRTYTCGPPTASRRFASSKAS